MIDGIFEGWTNCFVLQDPAEASTCGIHYLLSLFTTGFGVQLRSKRTFCVFYRFTMI